MFFVFAKISEKEKLGNLQLMRRSLPTFASFHNPTKRKGFAERARASILLQQVCLVFVAKLCCYNQSQHIIILLA
jgi:hypothetical protein